MARMLSEEPGKQLKQPVPVENVGGAGGVIGSDRGLKAPADGNTLIQTGVGQNAVAHRINSKVPYHSNNRLHPPHAGPLRAHRAGGAPLRALRHLPGVPGLWPRGSRQAELPYTPAASGHMAMELLKLLERSGHITAGKLRVLAMPDVQQLLLAQGAVAPGGPPADFARPIAGDRKRYALFIDVMVGDREGVVVIPAAIAAEVAQEAAEMTVFEDFVGEQVLAGRSILGLYPPTDQQAQDDFAAWRKAKKG